MSGGIDSFATALLLQQKGYEVIGVNLVLWEENDLAEVEKICRKLGISLLRRDGKRLFREVVVKSFVDGYLAGHTPSPCCVCNSWIKWKLLAAAALELGTFSIATGHYVRITEKQGLFYFRRGKDHQKDQSYFLWGVGQDILSQAHTPLGDYTKSEVRSWALTQGYEEIAGRRESMSICFLKGRDYRDFIRENTTASFSKGIIFDRNGQAIGEHEGVLNYTIGQKRGMPVINGQELYVAEMDAGRNVLIADVKSGLYTSILEVEDLNLQDIDDLFLPDLTVKVRGIGVNPDGFVKRMDIIPGGVRVYLSQPAWAVAPGQPVVFYWNDLVLGGGIVRKGRNEDFRQL